MKHKLLVATDGSAIAAKAVDTAVKLAKSLGADLVACCATPHDRYEAFGSPPPDAQAQLRTAAAAAANDALALVESTAAAAGVKLTTRIVEGELADRAVVETAEQEGCTMIVLGSHGRGAVGALLLGSVTQKILARTKLPVLVVR
ncbi:MAG TPA: universal stress protein [Burkholderiaceae bacterium]|nr:universal stress protein [Burkholderiaceae bacterium]